jgi:hypothetical protein
MESTPGDVHHVEFAKFPILPGKDLRRGETYTADEGRANCPESLTKDLGIAIFLITL